MKAFGFIFCFVISFLKVKGCTFPLNLNGEFLDSTKGVVNFNSTTLDGYSISDLGKFTFSCYQSSSNQYILKSNTFQYYELTWRAYLCWDLNEVATDQFYYYPKSTRLSDAGNERVKMYIEGSTVNTAEICAVSSVIPGSYKYLLKTDSINTASITCPTGLDTYMTYTADFGANDTCSGNTTELSGCASSSSLTFNYTAGCSTMIAYSASGTVHCLYNKVVNNLNYLTVINRQYSSGQNDTYYLSCLVLDTSSTGVIYATQHPQRCQDNQTSTYVQAPGAVMVFTYRDPCVAPTTTGPTTTDATTTASITTITLASVLTILAVIVIVVIILCYISYTKEIEEKQRKIEDKRAQDTVDGRYNEDDDIFGERGKAPPHVRITFPDYTKRSIKPGKVGVETSYGFDDWDGVDTIYGNGLKEPVTPSGVIPRSFDEKANREERMSNDSALGMEEDDIPPISGTPEQRTNHEVKAFKRVHGRQDFRSEDALVSTSKPMNLVKKIKKFAKKKRRRTSEIYQSNDVDVESGGNDVNYVRGIGQGAEADRGKDGRRRSNLVVNRSKQINEDDVDSPAKPTEKRIKQDYDVNSLLAGSVLDPSPRVGQTFKSSSKGVHYSPRSPGVIMEDLEDQVSKQYTEGFVTSDPEELHEQENADGDSKRSRLNMEGELNKEKVPVTPNMKIRRYENYGEVGDGSLSARNQSNYFQRLNRKSKKMTSSRQTKSAESASSLPELKKRGMSEDKYRRLLEELYPDKKYFDHTKKTCLPSEEHLSNKTNEGLEYLHGVAEYWEKQEPLKRPQSTPSKSRGPKSARTQKRSRQGSSLSRNLSMHSPETTSHGLPPDVS